jgi:hypothetical protein
LCNQWISELTREFAYRYWLPRLPKGVEPEWQRFDFQALVHHLVFVVNDYEKVTSETNPSGGITNFLELLHVSSRR